MGDARPAGRHEGARIRGQLYARLYAGRRVRYDRCGWNERGGAIAGEPGSMDNPWRSLPGKAPFVLSEDRAAIENFNTRADDDHRLHIDILPEPFLGRPSAEVVLLNLNPGFSEDELRYHHLDEYFRKAALANLAHVDQPFPFYFLDPSVDSPGHKWWRKRLRLLIERFSAQKLARHLLCLEYFGYHSKSYSGDTPLIPSQQYNFHLLRKAIERDAVIVVMRKRAMWFQMVPELAGADVYSLNSSQSVYVTPNNCPDGYAKIVERLS